MGDTAMGDTAMGDTAMGDTAMGDTPRLELRGVTRMHGEGHTAVTRWPTPTSPSRRASWWR